MHRVTKILERGTVTVGSLPDIDCDVASSKRDKALHYLSDKYSEVAKVGTFGYLKARSSVKAAARLLGVSPTIANELSKLIDETEKLGFSLRKSEVSSFITKYDLKRLVTIAEQLEGLINYFGIHPAGIVIAKDKITNSSAVWTNPNSPDMNVTMMNLSDIEDSGLVKYDFLGLLALDVLHDVSKMVDVDLDAILMDDQEVFRKISSGMDLYGMFQFEKTMTKQICEESKPTSILDLAAITSAIRPGSLHSGFHEVYARGGQTHRLPVINEALKETAGVLLYQEQLMDIAQKMAGFSEQQGDDLRRGIGKKKASLIEQYKEVFVNGSIDNGYSQEDAEEIYHWFQESANYAFNKSHAVSYGIISYQCAYFITYYPVEYYTCFLNAYIGQKKLIDGIKRVKKLGIDFLLPDIKNSENHFTNDGKSIRFGFECIKGLGVVACDRIKDNKGNLKLSEIIKNKLLTESDTKTLIQAGAFDNQISSRNMGLHMISQNSSALFLEEELEMVVSESKDDKGAMEKRLLGLPITANPLASVDAFNDHKNFSLSDLSTEHIGRKVTFVAMLREVLRKTTKSAKKDPYILCTLEDPYEEITGIIFKKQIPIVNDCLDSPDTPMLITGYLNIDNFGKEEDESNQNDVFGSGKISIQLVSPVKGGDMKKIKLCIPDGSSYKTLEKIKKTVVENQSDEGFKVFLLFKGKIIKTEYRLKKTDWVEDKLRKKYGVKLEVM